MEREAEPSNEIVEELVAFKIAPDPSISKTPPFEIVREFDKINVAEFKRINPETLKFWSKVIEREGET